MAGYSLDWEFPQQASAPNTLGSLLPREADSPSGRMGCRTWFPGLVLHAAPLAVYASTRAWAVSSQAGLTLPGQNAAQPPAIQTNCLLQAGLRLPTQAKPANICA
jgi:hypothetical protein